VNDDADSHVTRLTQPGHPFGVGAISILAMVSAAAREETA